MTKKGRGNNSDEVPAPWVGWPRWLRVLGPGVLVVFIGFTVWRMIFQGVLEKPSFDVPHFAAGAGDAGLFCAAALGVVAIALGVAWIVVERRWPIRGHAIVFTVGALVVVPWLLALTGGGMQRYAVGYTEESFRKLAERKRAGGKLRAGDVTSAVGEPLMKRSGDKGSEEWFFTYMPSCGFGWSKRGVKLDGAGWVTEVIFYDEP